ncbi:hypothetical protein B0J18DRAFT_200489 [Chaetomium sp. MPI-SDFR-AT-0129]|nr:hypothetical protein B0J18DRAFT_200489 [Chaetomium sp. MPI-SDFR-AT-0129]
MASFCLPPPWWGYAGRWVSSDVDTPHCSQNSLVSPLFGGLFTPLPLGNPKPDPAHARELMSDVAGRVAMLSMLMGGNPMMLGMMGLQPVEFGDTLKTRLGELEKAAEF